MEDLQEIQKQIDIMYSKGIKKVSHMYIIQQVALHIFIVESDSSKDKAIKYLKDEYSIVFNQKYIADAPDSETVYNYKKIRKHIKDFKNKPERYIYYWGLNDGNRVIFAIHREA